MEHTLPPRYACLTLFPATLIITTTHLARSYYLTLLYTFIYRVIHIADRHVYLLFYPILLVCPVSACVPDPHALFTAFVITTFPRYAVGLLFITYLLRWDLLPPAGIFYPTYTLLTCLPFHFIVSIVLPHPVPSHPVPACLYIPPALHCLQCYLFILLPAWLCHLVSVKHCWGAIVPTTCHLRPTLHTCPCHRPAAHLPLFYACLGATPRTSALLLTCHLAIPFITHMMPATTTHLPPHTQTPPSPCIPCYHLLPHSGTACPLPEPHTCVPHSCLPRTNTVLGLYLAQQATAASSLVYRFYHLPRFAGRTRHQPAWIRDATLLLPLP